MPPTNDHRHPYQQMPDHHPCRGARGTWRQHKRGTPEGRLSPGPRDYATVGELYEVLAQSLDACAAALGEAALFVGDPALQVDATLAPLQGVMAVTDLLSAHQAIETIVTQGEGAGGEEIDWRRGLSPMVRSFGVGPGADGCT